MGEPSTPQQAPDPALLQEQQQAQNELVKQLQTQAAGDTASIMARFGTRMALSGVAAPSVGGA